MGDRGAPGRRLKSSVALWAVGLCLACLAASTRPVTLPVRWEVPDDESQQAMEKIIRELYAKAYADRTPAGRRKLARTLLQQAEQTGGDPTARYVLLRESAALASEGGEAVVAMQALLLMGRAYRVDGWRLKEGALRQIVRVVHDGSLAKGAAEQAMNLADQAFLEGRHETAGRLLQLARAAANQSGQVGVVLKVRARQKEMALLERRWGEYQAAEARLRAGQGDAADRLLCGTMRCFMLGDWAGGLPLLAGGGDGTLGQLARRESEAGKGEALACLGVANGWWDYAARLDRLARRQVLGHAAQWYRRARPGVSGVDLQLVERRLAQAPLTPDEINGLASGLAAGIYAGERFEHLLTRRVDSQVNFDWGVGRVGPTLPKDDFSIRWRGYLVARDEGTYVFVLLANRGGRLILDGRTLIDADNLSRKRNGARAEVGLTPGPHAIRVECWDSSGSARAILQWITPGSSKPRVIPADVLKHQP